MLSAFRKVCFNHGSRIPFQLQLWNKVPLPPVRTLFIQPKPDFIPTLTTLDIIEKFAADIGTAEAYSPDGLKDVMVERKKLIELLPKSQTELPTRRMQDSIASAVIPISTNKELREKYVTFFGTVRVGRLLEELDVFAVWCAYKHILNPKSEGHRNPYSIVTALVDSIHFSHEYTMTSTEDIRLSGHVSWVGSTSLEVSIIVDQMNEAGQWSKVTKAVFVLVARNPANKGPAIVNSLVAETPEEKKYIEQGEVRNQKRKAVSQASLLLKPPNKEEGEIIHNMFLNTFHPVLGNVANLDVNMMRNTAINTLLLCHPQYRNRFNKIFGGFIMRQAFELAYSNAYLYATTRPKIINIDDISFKKPVEIGSILRFRAMVGYVEDQYMHIPVSAEVVNPETGSTDVTNVFQFTFIAADQNTPLKVVVPKTYMEAVAYLESRRHFKEMMEQVNSQK